MAEKTADVAVVGTAQTRYRRVEDQNFPAMIHEAALGALKDAGLSIKDVDAVVFGSSPEYFIGVNYPEKWCVDAAGGYLKPYMRIHTGGTVGISTAVAGYYHVASGLFDVVLAVSGDKLTDGSVQAGLATVSYPLYSRRFSAGAVGGAGMGFRDVMNKKGITLKQATRVAVKQRRNALLNPYAHLKVSDISEEMVEKSRVISEPLRMLDSCPTSDGAAAMVFASEGRAEELTDNPAWVKAAVSCSEPPSYADRDNILEPKALLCAVKRAYEKAGITNPREQIDVAEVYDPFSFQEILFAEHMGFAENGKGYELVDSGATEITGDIPINPSGGVLSANTIGCSAMARAVEAVLQVRGQAGEHQVKGANTALAHGWGGTFQFHVIMIFSRER
jgi:acetyl-CoA C-acetyltransferase